MNEFILTVADLRNALKGLSGTAEIRIKVPEKGKGNHMLHGMRVTYNKDWKAYTLITTEI